MSGAPLLDVRELRVQFPGPRGPVRAVDGVAFTLHRGETIGLVGESGCGKSSLARALVGLARPRSGSIRFDGTELVGLSRRALRPLRSRLQMVFQDPTASLDPRLTVASILMEPLRIAGPGARQARAARIPELLSAVGLDVTLQHRYPHELSGGQRQRVGIARALALEPEALILDEPVSALDVSVQAQVLNLLEDLRARLGLAYVFIAHHLAVVRHVSDRVAVMYLGRIVELAPRDALFGAPLHPYTEALLSAVPIPDPALQARRRRISLPGEVPSPDQQLPGCPFRSRCPRAFERCAVEAPQLREHRPGHRAACHLPERVQ